MVTKRVLSLLLDETTSADVARDRLCPDDPRAIDEGRLFADGRRVLDKQELLPAYVLLTCYAPRTSHEEVPVVLEEREGILAVYKPAAWTSEPDRTGNSVCLRSYLTEQFHGRHLHVATRLDVGVSGLVLVATDPRSRQHLDRLILEGTLHRRYLAIVAGNPPPQGHWRGSVEEPQAGKGREAITDFECLAQLELPPRAQLGTLPLGAMVALLHFLPKTGRRHQLRIHASRGGCPILGDRRYGGPKRLIAPDGRVIEFGRIYLHARGTQLVLPSGQPWTVHCPVDDEMPGLWEMLGGSHAQIP